MKHYSYIHQDYQSPKLSFGKMNFFLSNYPIYIIQTNKDRIIQKLKIYIKKLPHMH